MSSETPASDQAPSMIGAHIKYVEGAISEALGYETGKETKEQAVQEMRDAKAASGPINPSQSGILGTVESTAGKVTGCEGMVSEGEARKPIGSEEANGTG